MRKLVILGAGTAGTIMANHLRRKLVSDEWKITIVDQEKTHYYQPGYLFLPFDIYKPKQLKKSIKKFIPKGVKLVQDGIDKIVPSSNTVLLESGDVLSYDVLVIATGAKIAPQETDGMLGPSWHKDIFDFYTFAGAKALRDKLRDWPGGKLVVHICEMPIKCPVAPLEFTFLADSFFTEKGMRDRVELIFVTPLSGAFTKPTATEKLGHLLRDKDIQLVTDFAIEKVDGENKRIIDYGGKQVDFDLLVTVPTNMGDEAIARSGMGDDLNFVPTNNATLQTTVKENIFAIGDATNIPASKAGSVAHFESEILTENILRFIDGQPLKEEFDGHANCFVETGHGKALLIDFNYTHEPAEGTFPFPGVGPLKLLKESRMNHYGKLAFRWVYWNMLLPGHHIPFVTSKMDERGKKLKKTKQKAEVSSG
jgi:sulfide:quinone oxidoreductase